MKIYFVCGICILLTLTSCNQDKLSSLENELKEKKNEIKELNTEIDNLKGELLSVNEQLSVINSKKNKIRDYTNEEIIQIIKSERNFKCPKTLIKDFVVRKTNSNKYEVRFYQYMDRFGSKKHYWDKIIVMIQVFPGDKYTYNVIQGTICTV